MIKGPRAFYQGMIMQYQFDDLTIRLDQRGLDHYEKLSYPIRYGTYSEILAGPFVFQFNLNGEIKYIQCKRGYSMEPTEWLKRTVGNDWVYYYSGGYNGSFDAMGEYYVPCFTYPSNSVLGGNPFKSGILDLTATRLKETIDQVSSLAGRENHPDLQLFLDGLFRNTPRKLRERADAFHRMIGGTISVLPPDARHVDYDVIPVTISDGCLYNCGFCTVKSGRGFKRRSGKDIREQIGQLKAFYGRDIRNFNSIFLGQHDALHAGKDSISLAIEEAYDAFDFTSSNIKGHRLFIFGSADSLLKAPDTLFAYLDRSPYETYINIGLESVDDSTLTRLGKPLTSNKVKDAFSRCTEINRTYPGVEVTVNFLYGDEFPETHIPKVLELIGDHNPRYYPKGSVYLSPYGLIRDRRSLVTGFKLIKNQCRLPVFLYIIQRL